MSSHLRCCQIHRTTAVSALQWHKITWVSVCPPPCKLLCCGLFAGAIGAMQGHMLLEEG